jgi:hypothetical protein
MAEHTYRLTVEGELSDIVATTLHGMTLHGMTSTRAEGNTSLTGKVRDQSELQGLLQRVSALGLVLLEVRPIDKRSNPGLELDLSTITRNPQLRTWEFPTLGDGNGGV